MELEQKFLELKEKQEAAFMAHIYYGDPNEEFSLELIKTLCNSGVDILEFGIPFTDPIADGPTFQAACDRALKNGITVERSFSAIKKIRKLGIVQPIVVTSYYNLIYRSGVEDFIEKIRNAGAQGLIVPDAPIEESELLLKFGQKYNVKIILLITPRTSPQRLVKICSAANGFLYIVNVEGVTGVRTNLGARVSNLIKGARTQTNIPLLAGFGISKAEQVSQILKGGVDGAIVGSAIAKIYEKNLGNPEKTLPEIAEFCKAIKNACKPAAEQKSREQSLLLKNVKYKIQHRGG